MHRPRRTANSGSTRARRAARRLAKEYALLQTSPLTNCAASPVVNAAGDVTNLFEWHVNISSTNIELGGVPFHFIILFPETYPDRAPVVTPQSYIKHPNVLGRRDPYICLDMLTMSEDTICTPYRGWTNAYTVSSILIQLQSFLFEVSPTKDQCLDMITNANALTCSCGHGINGVCFPEIESQILDEEYETLILEQLQPGDKLRVVVQFDFNNRAHYSTKDFMRLGDRLEVQDVTSLGCFVQRIPQPWTKTRTLPVDHLNKVVLIEENATMDTSEPEERIESYLDEREPTGLYYFDDVPEHVLQVLLEFLNWDDLTRVSLIAEEYGNSMLKSKRLQMQSYRCFYTLLDATDTDTILGFGVQCVRMPRKSRKTGTKKMYLQKLHVSFDIMSHVAFSVCKVRNNVWKDRKVDGFIPLYINKEHGMKAMMLNRRELPRLLGDGPEFTTDTILQIYGRAMNTTVVDMMLSVEDVETGQLQLTDSIKALEGFMALHHTLLAYALQYPQLVDQCEEYVGKFIHDVHARDKEIVPDIGELLIALSLTDFTWAEFVLAWLEEFVMRNVRWVLAKYPNLLTAETEFSCVRLNQAYAASRTGKRLAMFQRFFIERIASPPELEGNPGKNFILFQQYNERCGRPPLGLAKELQWHSRQVLACADWFTFFDLVGFVAPSAENVWKWLHNAAMISGRKQYHSDSSILHFSESHMVSPHNRQHTVPHNCLCSGRIVEVRPSSAHTDAAESLVVRTMPQTDKLDVAFCVDITGSMGSWIHAAKSQVNATMTKLRKSGKRVRFGFVAYRDHCDKEEVTTVTDFTERVDECQTTVNSWYAGGGGDIPEALATALGEVGDLSWDNEAQRICIVITDAPPHGLGDPSTQDSYPKGPPDGSDVFLNTHTLGLAGVSLYIVFTGDNALEESVYRGLAERTGGSFLRLTDAAAEQLSQIVLASSLEETFLDELAETVMPFYDQIKATHGIARREQLEYQLHATCVSENITASTVLFEEPLSRGLEKQVEDFVLCMDLAHCRSMTSHEYYRLFPGSRSTFELVKKEQVVSRNQIRKILARVEHQRALNDIKAHGCRFQRPEWSAESAAIRWDAFSARQPHHVRTTLENFAPWNPLTRSTLVHYGKIPSTRLRARALPLTDNYESKKKVKYLQVQSTRGVNIREEPNKHSGCVGKLANMAIIKILGREGPWIQHSKGWSKWSKGIFARHTPKDSKLFGKPKPKPKPKREEPIFAWKQNDRIKCKRSMSIRGIAIEGGDEFIVLSVSRGNGGDYMLKPLHRTGRTIGVKNSEYMIGCFDILPPEVTHVKAEATVMPQNPPNPGAPQYTVGQKLLCVPRQHITTGTAKWRQCTVTAVHPFTCVFDHNGNEIRRHLYPHLSFKPAPSPIPEEPVVEITPELASAGSPLAEISPATLPNVPTAQPTTELGSGSGAGNAVGSSSVRAPLPPEYDFHTYEGNHTAEIEVLATPRYYTTSRRCVVRAELNCRSEKLGTVPAESLIRVDQIYKQRARVLCRFNGWCWLSSPHGSMVHLKNEERSPSTGRRAPANVHHHESTRV